MWITRGWNELDVDLVTAAGRVVGGIAATLLVQTELDRLTSAQGARPHGVAQRGTLWPVALIPAAVRTADLMRVLAGGRAGRGDDVQALDELLPHSFSLVEQWA